MNKRRGFSDIDKWPLYFVVSGSIIFLSPFIGAFFGFLVVYVVLFPVAIVMNIRDKRTYEEIRQDADNYIASAEKFFEKHPTNIKIFEEMPEYRVPEKA